MQSCDVLIGGAGPAGSACAWKLCQAGADVLVLERAAFPRDKACAGWITPQTVDELALDLERYRRGRTLQAITGFRIGLIGRARDVSVGYGRTVSYAIRRCEFDEYLLSRSAARVEFGTGIASIRRDRDDWIVNEAVRARMLVGAGGHFCRVAAWLNDPAARDGGLPVVLAREAEFPIAGESFSTAAAVPEFYFAPDFSGYGWCCRKQDFINVGFGRLVRTGRDHPSGGDGLPTATAEFVGFLARLGRVPPRRDAWRWHGHAYLLRDAVHRRVVDAGVLLVGDAAGLAYPQSGEGIRPAVESGLLAAATIMESAGGYTREALSSYEERLHARFGWGSAAPRRAVSPGVMSAAGRVLIGIPWFVRRFVLDRWFLHAAEAPLA